MSASPYIYIYTSCTKPKPSHCLQALCELSQAWQSLVLSAAAKGEDPADAQQTRSAQDLKYALEVSDDEIYSAR